MHGLVKKPFHTTGSSEHLSGLLDRRNHHGEDVLYGRADTRSTSLVASSNWVAETKRKCICTVQLDHQNRTITTTFSSYKLERRSHHNFSCRPPTASSCREHSFVGQVQWLAVWGLRSFGMYHPSSRSMHMRTKKAPTQPPYRYSSQCTKFCFVPARSETTRDQSETVASP